MRYALVILGSVFLAEAAGCESAVTGEDRLQVGTDSGPDSSAVSCGGAGGSAPEAGVAGQGGVKDAAPDWEGAGTGGGAGHCDNLSGVGGAETQQDGMSWCPGVPGTRTYTLVHQVDSDCDGTPEECSRTEEAVLGSGAIVRFASYEGCSCDIVDAPLFFCNQKGTFVSLGWDLDRNGNWDHNCSYTDYDETGRVMSVVTLPNCASEYECISYRYDSFGRRYVMTSGCGGRAGYGCTVMLHEEEWRPAELGFDEECNQTYTGCVRGSLFFDAVQARDPQCNGRSTSDCEHIFYDAEGCPRHVALDPACDLRLARCVAVVKAAPGCAWLSVGSDSNCDGLPEGPCRYMDRMGMPAEGPMDIDCNGEMDHHCRVSQQGESPEANSRWLREGMDEDCDGIPERECEISEWVGR